MNFSISIKGLAIISLSAALGFCLALLAPTFIRWINNTTETSVSYVEKTYEQKKLFQTNVVNDQKSTAENSDNEKSLPAPQFDSQNKTTNITAPVHRDEKYTANPFINDLITQSTLPALVSIDFRSFDINACTSESKEVLLSFIQFKLMYNRLTNGGQPR